MCLKYSKVAQNVLELLSLRAGILSRHHYGRLGEHSINRAVAQPSWDSDTDLLSCLGLSSNLHTLKLLSSRDHTNACSAKFLKSHIEFY